MATRRICEYTCILRAATCSLYEQNLWKFFFFFLPLRSFFGTVSGLKQHLGSTFTEPLPARRKTVPRYWSSTPMSSGILCAGKRYNGQTTLSADHLKFTSSRALQFPPEAWLRMSLANGSITRMTIRPSGRVTLKALGSTGHMPPELVTFS